MCSSDLARAAFVNGAYGHACDLDDTHVGSMHHAGASILPAVLAMCEREDADGRALLEAAIVGYESSLRIGLATGYALLFEGDDYIGSAVNTAARLCDSAGAFEVLIPVDQVEELPEGVRTIHHAPLALRGFTEPLEVCGLTGDPVITDRNDTGELWTRSPFVM